MTETTITDAVLTRRRATVAQLQQQWDQHDRGMTQSRTRIQAAWDVLERCAPGLVPDGLDQELKAFQVRMPYATTVPLHTLQLVIDKWPRVRRNKRNTSMQAEGDATRIEQITQAVMDLKYAWDEAAGWVLNEGIAFSVVMPSLADWRDVPELHETDVHGRRRIAARYRRDVTKRKPTDDGYEDEALDEEESRKAYEQEKDDYLSCHVPITIKNYSRMHALPINPRREGKRWVCDGLITCEEWSVNTVLQQNMVFEGLDRLLEAPALGAQTVTVYSLWYQDEDGPWVAYACQGKPTRYRVTSEDGEELVDAIIDLKQWGIDRLPISIGTGWNLPHRDLDKSIVPFPWVFGDTWSTMATLLSAVLRRAYKLAWFGGMIKPDPQVLARLQQEGRETEWLEKPLQWKEVSGDIQFPVPPSVGNDTWQVFAALSASQAEEGTPAASVGGEGATGATDRAMIQTGTLRGISQVVDGALSLYQQTAEHVLRALVGISRTVRPVVVAYDSPIAGQRGKQTQLLTMDPDLPGKNLTISAEYPVEPGENLAKAQQFIEAYKGGAMTFRQMREDGFGDPAPDVTLMELLEEQYLMSPEFQQELQMEVAAYAEDQRRQTMLKLQAAGQATRGGQLRGYGQGVPDPSGGMMSLGNPAQSALAGLAGGAMGQAQVDAQANSLGSMP